MYMRNPTAVQNYLREPDSSTELQNYLREPDSSTELLRCFPGGICREWEEGETREGREERQGRETQGREGGERHARERDRGREESVFKAEEEGAQIPQPASQRGTGTKGKEAEEGVCRYPSPPAGVEREQRGRRQKTWFSVPRPAPGALSEAGWGGCERK